MCIYIYIYIFIYMCVWLNNKDTFCLYDFIKILSSFGFRLELVDEFTKIVLSAFGPFIGHHQRLLTCKKLINVKNIKIYYKKMLLEAWRSCVVEIKSQYIFQQDNTPTHIIITIKSWFEQHFLPTQSLDLHLIKNI